MMYVDLMGMEKALIFVGYDYSKVSYTALTNAEKIQRKKYIEAGYKDENIKTVYGANIDDLNAGLSSGNFKEAAIVAHGLPDSISLTNGGTGIQIITSETVSQISPINNKQMIITLDSCMTGYGRNPIAQQFAEQIRTTVLAPESFLYVDPSEDDFIDAGQNRFNFVWGLTSKYLSLDAIFTTF